MDESILVPGEKGTLKDGEPHPSARTALKYVSKIPAEELFKFKEAFSSSSLSGNEQAEILSETLSRIMDGGKVSDRYLLGLAWAIRDLMEKR